MSPSHAVPSSNILHDVLTLFFLAGFVWIGLVGLFVAGIAAYLYPIWFCWKHNRANFERVVKITVFMGWTGICWFYALWLGAKRGKEKKRFPVRNCDETQAS